MLPQPRILIVAALATTLALGCSMATRLSRDASQRAAAHTAAGDYEDAAREIQIALAVQPEDPRLHLQAANIYRLLGKPGVAVNHLEEALKLAPHDVQSWIVLGQIESERWNITDAYVAYRRATELAPDDIRAVSGLALAADALGFDEEASRSYARWAELEREREERLEQKR